MDARAAKKASCAKKEMIMQKNYKQIVADKISGGEQVALYCHGIYATYMLCYLEKFHGVVPTVIVDNDIRKKGMAEFGVPVMPFSEAMEQFSSLQFFICSDDFKYAIIGDMLEKDIDPERIINYVPVEKKTTCLYFYNRLLLAAGMNNEAAHTISHCNVDAFKTQIATTKIYAADGAFPHAKNILDNAFLSFEKNETATCQSCPMMKEQYIVHSSYKKHYKSVAFYQETCSDCLCHCVYCCVGGIDAHMPNEKIDYPNYSNFLNAVFALDRLDDDFTCAVDMSERDLDKKIGIAVKSLGAAGLEPLSYKINSCLLTYSKSTEMLLENGLAYVVWSLDAGTRETYRKIKQVDGFDRAVENAKRLVAHDAFGGRLIVPKYLIVKGVNDTAQEFDAFLKVVSGLGPKVKTVSLSFDFFVDADENDRRFIQNCYDKIIKNDMQLTYINNSKPVTEALQMYSILHTNREERI